MDVINGKFYEICCASNFTIFGAILITINYQLHDLKSNIPIFINIFRRTVCTQLFFQLIFSLKTDIEKALIY